MGGYIGSKAVNLSTTAADVTGNATIGGNLTVTGTTVTIDSANAQTVDLGDNDKIRLGDGDDLQIYHDGSNSYVDDAGTGRLYLRGNDRVQIQKYTGDDMITAIADGAVKLYYDNSNKFETTSSGVSVNGNIANASNMTLDVAGYIILDTDDGNIYLNDDGAGFGQISGASQNLTFKSSTSDKDIIFQGNDGGSSITALTLDMSEGGKAAFNAGATFGNHLEIDAGSSGMIDFGDLSGGYGRLYADSGGTYIGSKSNDDLILRTNDKRNKYEYFDIYDYRSKKMLVSGIPINQRLKQKVE